MPASIQIEALKYISEKAKDENDNNKVGVQKEQIEALATRVAMDGKSTIPINSFLNLLPRK